VWSRAEWASGHFRGSMKSIQQIKKAMLKKRKSSTTISSKDLLSTGSTCLNLGLTGRASGGIPKGVFLLWVGDSSTGKTVTGLTILAEASINPEFDEYTLVFINAENGALMNIKKRYGRKLKERMQVETPSTLEEFHELVLSLLGAGPCIILVDSFDALFPKEDEDALTDSKIKQGYGLAKAKKNSSQFRLINNRLKKTGSILVGISQTRQNIGFGSQFNPRTRSGGDAIHFYNRLELWTSLRGHIIKEVNKVKRKIGRLIKVKIVKNHICGWEGELDISIYRSIGLDDIGDCIDFLVKEGIWSETKKVIYAKDFDVKKKKEDLIAWIEARDLEKKLVSIVNTTWHDIETACAVKRKLRY
jgi:RecA/RadA recombinase